MKKLSKKRLAWLNRQAILIRKAQRRKSGQAKVIPPWWHRSIDAPRIFSLRQKNTRAELLNFIDSIFSNKYPREKLRLNFQQTEQIMPEAMLLFLARLEQATTLKEQFSKIKIAPPINHNIRKQSRIMQVLSKVGAYELCNQDINIASTDETVFFWKKLHGNTKTPLNPKNIRNFLEDGEATTTSGILTVAVKEALLNILHHAYGSATGSWWAFVHVRGNKRTVVVCDLGIGIPGSIRQGGNDIQKQILSRVTRIADRLGHRPKDSEFIRGSVKYGASGTGNRHRGKGLPKMKQAIDSIDTSGALLNIFSNKGCYTVVSDRRNPILYDYPNSIGGTVVTWTIPINQDDVEER